MHVIAVISWMAGMLYLPRLFVYHCGAEPGSEQSETFKVMERRLLRVIMTPAMIVTWLLGLWLVLRGPVAHAPAGCTPSSLLVLVMSALHGISGRWTTRFRRDRNTHTRNSIGSINEVPTVLMIVIVILVVVKPF